jgi:tetraacyldisaccharide-1-P 4'-kinase
MIRVAGPSRHLTHSVAADTDQFLSGQKTEANSARTTAEAVASPPYGSDRANTDSPDMPESAWAVMAEANRRHVPLISAALRPEPSEAEALRGRKVVAFAGIGRPSKFFATLRSIGVDLVAERGFPDHHNFSANELSSLAEEARSADALLMTTEKDMARIGDLAQNGIGGTARLTEIPLCALRIGLDIADSDRLDSLLKGVIRARWPDSLGA